MKPKRILNGYIVVYMPNHPKAMKSQNWEGYVYEHIVSAEDKLNRATNKKENVHHLDLNRKNNNPENLIVLEKEQHTCLHSWIDKGMPINKKSNINPTRYCANPTCDRIVQSPKNNYCSVDCYNIVNRKVKRPDKELLEKLITEKSFLALSKEFGVSDNAIRKWAKSYGIVIENRKWAKTKSQV